jgi:hypothetical protein
LHPGVKLLKNSKVKGEQMIELSKKYRIHFELNDNVTLECLSTVKQKSGESRQEWQIVGYFSTVKAAIKSYCDKELRNSTSMEDLFLRLNRLEHQIDQLFKIRGLDYLEAS